MATRPIDWRRLEVGAMDSSRWNRWAKVYVFILSDSRLSARDLRVYVAIASFADEHGHCWPKRKTLSEMTGIAPNHISVSTAKLMRLGYLLKTGNGGRHKPASYWLVTPEARTAADIAAAQKPVPMGVQV